MANLTPGAWLGIALFAGYALWLFAFFTWLRPRAMRAVGKRLATRVVESTRIVDAGTWSAEDDAPLAKAGTVLAADVTLTLLGTVGMAALVFVPAFLVAETGVLLPWQSRITGRAVELRVQGPVAMETQAARVALPIEVDNTGPTALRACRATVEGYTSRNGYLNGRSTFFDLAPGARAAAIVRLEATHPPRGEHAVRIAVECDNERLAVGTVTVTVR